MPRSVAKETSVPSAAPTPSKPNQFRLIISSAGWVAIGFALSQLIRLISNLVLARFLAPEDFGIVSIVNSLLLGLILLSDIGIAQSVIRDHRGNNKVFLDAAWTLQLMRGGALALLCFFLAYPLSIFYEDDKLFWLLMVAGITPVIQGLTSIGFIVAYKNLKAKTVSIIELASQCTSITTMVALASIWPSYWVLLIGAFTAIITKVALGYIYFPNARGRLVFSRRISSRIFHFGKWIFVSTAATYFSGAASGLIVGKFVTFTELGIFQIGAILATLVDNLNNQLDNNVTMSAFAKIDYSQPTFKKKISQIRALKLCLLLPVSIFLVIFGDEVVKLLFDERYQSAGWILQVMALSHIPNLISGVTPYYLARGKSLLVLKINIVKLCLFYLCIIGFGIQLGAQGIVIGIAAHNFAKMLYEIWVQHKERIMDLRIELLASIFSLIIIQLGLLLTGPIELPSGSSLLIFP